jgi:tetratricopeptide (TPR) repeat protein
VLSRRAKRIILVIGLIQVLLILALMALPDVVLAIPGRFRVALAERSPALSDIAENLIEQVAPVDEFLPTPDAMGDRPRITIPSIIVSEEPTATHTPLPTAAALVPASGDELVETESQPEPTQTSTPVPRPTSIPTPLPDQIHLQDFTRIQQSFNNCGPANLTQVLNWYGDETTQALAAAYLKPNPEDRNVSPWQLSDYVNEFTELRSTVHSGGTLEMLKQFLAAGFPVVVEKGYEPDTSSSQGWFGHYLTVFGYDEEKQEFYGLDSYVQPEPGGRIETYDSMEEFWSHFNYTFYVVYEPERESEVYEILGPELLEPFKMWENAAIRAQADIDDNPDNAFAWFNLGTSLTRIGEIIGDATYYNNGSLAFDQARSIGLPPRKLWYEHRPYLAYMKTGRYDDMIDLADAVLSTQGGRNVEETYLYMGHALLFQGDVRGAREAYQRAIELNENFYPAEIALQSIG